MSEWKCGKCGKIYTVEEFLLLDKVKMVESDINPSEEHGFTGVCGCGYRFHLDRWRLNDDVNVKTDEGYIKTTVSTIDMELDHSFEEGKYIWYETMAFPGGLGEDKSENKSEKIECYYVNNYETKEEAIEDHNRIVNLLKEGKYKIEDSDGKKELVILEEEG